MVICDEAAKFRLQEIHTPTFGDWIRQPHLNTTLQKVRIQARGGYSHCGLTGGSSQG